jgi:hypothetical protein
MVRLKVVGPAVPAELMADIDIAVVAIAFGVPVNRPPAERLAHPGNPVPLQLIGWVPLAANWKLYATPMVPLVIGLVVVMVGAVPPLTTVREKAVGPAEPAELVAVIIIEVTATALGVPVSRPPDDKLAHPGSPVPLQVIGAPPVAVN